MERGIGSDAGPHEKRAALTTIVVADEPLLTQDGPRARRVRRDPRRAVGDDLPAIACRRVGLARIVGIAPLNAVVEMLGRRSVRIDALVPVLARTVEREKRCNPRRLLGSRTVVTCDIV